MAMSKVQNIGQAYSNTPSESSLKGNMQPTTPLVRTEKALEILFSNKLTILILYECVEWTQI
jgi:hypothetical protein